MPELEPIGQTQGIKHYKTGQTPSLPPSSPGGMLRKLPPLIKPQEMPPEIMKRIIKDSTDFVTIREMLKAYQRTGDNKAWDTFRQKIPDDILGLWGSILSECRRNGFIGPWAHDEKIHWRQILSTNKVVGDLCTLCKRECKRREDIDSGENKLRWLADNNFEEPKPCWEEVT